MHAYIHTYVHPCIHTREGDWGERGLGGWGGGSKVCRNWPEAQAPARAPARPARPARRWRQLGQGPAGLAGQGGGCQPADWPANSCLGRKGKRGSGSPGPEPVFQDLGLLHQARKRKKLGADCATSCLLWISLFVRSRCQNLVLALAT